MIVVVRSMSVSVSTTGQSWCGEGPPSLAGLKRHGLTNIYSANIRKVEGIFKIVDANPSKRGSVMPDRGGGFPRWQM